MSRVPWRWEERDFGFRFRQGAGRGAAECYQAGEPRDFYVVPASQRKLDKARLDELNGRLAPPASPRIVANPWRNYDHDWDWIATDDGLCLNYAGCLDREEIDRREDEGVQRAMERVAELVQRPDPVPVTLKLVQDLHVDLMGIIYPFAGRWRTVELHRGEGPTRWPLPPSGIQPLMAVLQRDVFSRSPIISSVDQEIFAFASEVMNELIAIHPFREGNGRTAFLLGNFILMQNEMLPLTTYERHADQARYYAACEAGRIHKDYGPLADLLCEWEDQALARWVERHG